MVVDWCGLLAPEGGEAAVETRFPEPASWAKAGVDARAKIAPVVAKKVNFMVINSLVGPFTLH